jgi:hypothetical protein
MSLWRKVRSGDQFNFPADLFNTLVDVANWWKSLRQSTSGLPGPWGDGQAGTVRVKNTSNEHRSAGEVLGIDTVWPSPGSSAAFKFGPKVLHGVTPAAKHWGKYVVLLEPIRAGKIGRGRIAGCCPVRLVLSDDAATHCDIYPDDATGLRAGFSGSAEILDREEGTGSVWAYVRLGVVPPEIPFRLTGNLTKGGTAPAVVLGRLDYAATATTIDVKDTRSSWPDATAGTGGWARLKAESDGLVYEIVDLFCGGTVP